MKEKGEAYEAPKRLSGGRTRLETPWERKRPRNAPETSKEDDVSRISTSIYVSNFPESFSAKDLFHSCKQYGHVVDTFIPFKRSKDGKRFGFVRFINVFNVERLKFGYNRNINNVRAKEGKHRGGSWFSVLKQASFDFIPEGRIIWVEIEGVPFKLWSKNTFKWIAAKWGELRGVDDHEEEGFHSKRNHSDEVEVLETVFKESLEQKVNQSEEPFGIYLLLNKNNDKSKNMKPFDHSLKYPPGFTPNGDNHEYCMHEENAQSVNKANSLNCNMEENQNGQERNS
nr:nucleotide-binding alpha-beta plait domain-containing protein [Tanacetum cinerariifolium]